MQFSMEGAWFSKLTAGETPAYPVVLAGEDACVPRHLIAGGDACIPGRHGEYSYNGAAWRLHILEKDERKNCYDRLF